MIDLKINDKPYSIPSSWNDITYAKYCALLAKDELPLAVKVANYSGLPVAIVSSMSLTQFVFVCECIAFMESPDTVESFAAPYAVDVNIFKESYAKMEQAKDLLRKAEMPILAAGEIIKLYTDEDISEQPITQAMPAIAFFLNSLSVSL